MDDQKQFLLQLAARYPILSKAYSDGTLGGNEEWLVNIAKEFYYAGRNDAFLEGVEDE